MIGRVRYVCIAALMHGFAYAAAPQGKVADTIAERVAPCTTCHGKGNPRPHGMPPFAHVLSDGEIAAVVSYVCAAWGNDANAVTQLQVSRYRQ